MHLYQVGQLYHPSRASWPETIQYNFRGGEHELVLFLRRPTEEEVNAVKKGKKEFALVDAGAVLFLLHRFGELPWSDSPYSWWNVPADQRTTPPAPGTKGALVSIILVDAATGIIKALVAVSWPESFLNSVHDAIHQQIAKQPAPGQIDAAIAAAYHRYPTTSAMLKAATARCIGGEPDPNREGLQAAYRTLRGAIPEQYQGRPDDVRNLAGSEPERLSLQDARAALEGAVSPEVYEVVFSADPAAFWLAGGRVWFDDAEFGDVVATEDLTYDDDYGLRSKKW